MLVGSLAIQDSGVIPAVRWCVARARRPIGKRKEVILCIVDQVQLTLCHDGVDAKRQPIGVLFHGF